VVAARAITHADAAICICSGSIGPVTFGFLRPVILLPESFLELDDEAQSGIVCHELLHVRRHDWLVTMFEESIAVLFWFHPAVWWLLAQTRLAREQLVDSEVVRLTAGCEAYVNALLSIAGARPSLDLAPAPLFLRWRHLTQRVHSLLREVNMSKLRLLASYTFITAILALVAVIAFTSFPLVGQPQVREMAAADAPGIHVDPGAAILYRPAIFYPPAAERGGIKGTVALDLTLNGKGEVADARVVSGPQELRQTALQSALTWHYAAGASANVRATIDFAPATSATEAEMQELVCHDTTADGVLKTIDISKLPEGLQPVIWQKVQGFQGQPFSNALMCQIRAGVREIDSQVGFGWLSEDRRSRQIPHVGFVIRASRSAPRRETDVSLPQSEFCDSGRRDGARFQANPPGRTGVPTRRQNNRCHRNRQAGAAGGRRRPCPADPCRQRSRTVGPRRDRRGQTVDLSADDVGWTRSGS
jgi:TonB family protein